jgi:preprotein translocase subunit SecD
MSCSACLLAAVLSLAGQATVRAQDQAPGPGKRLPDGVYAVRREGAKETDVLPLKDGEALVVNRHRYLKDGENEPARFLVVRRAPEVALDLAGAPKAIEEGGEVVRILLRLRPQAAAALERLTRDHLGRPVAIVLGGEVVTVHKVREVIKGGDVQITSCAAGAAPYLLKQLRDHYRGR